MEFTTLKSKKNPEYKKEYEIYRILLFLINQICGGVNIILFVLKLGQMFNVIFSSSIAIFYLLLNFYFNLKTTKIKQIFIFLNLLILQFLFLDYQEEKMFLSTVIGNIELSKINFLALFFIIDSFVLIFLYYLNVYYPSHIYEK